MLANELYISGSNHPKKIQNSKKKKFRKHPENK